MMDRLSLGGKLGLGLLLGILGVGFYATRAGGLLVRREAVAPAIGCIMETWLEGAKQDADQSLDGKEFFDMLEAASNQYREGTCCWGQDGYHRCRNGFVKYVIPERPKPEPPQAEKELDQSKIDPAKVDAEKAKVGKPEEKPVKKPEPKPDAKK